MTGQSGSWFAFRMAWRETRSAAGKFVFLLAAVAIGAGALTAVAGFNESVRFTLMKEARTLMAADIMIRLPIKPLPDELAYVEGLEQRGIEYTRVTETVSMAASGPQPPILVSVKGADLDVYPYYGILELDPADAPLDEHSVAVSDDLLLRLRIGVGDQVRIGEREYRIVARIRREPDRMTTGFTLGPRVLFTREGLAATGIITDMSRVTERLLLRLPEDFGERRAEQLIDELEDRFRRRGRVSDYTETNPTLTRALNRSTRFLSLVSLIALIVGGLGVGATMQSHLRQKMTSIAFMKCIGGRSDQIVRIYLVQAVMLGLAGGVLGAVIGAFAQSAFARLMAGYFDVEVTLIWPVTAMVQGTIVGMISAALFSLPALLAISEVRPALILRQDYARAPRSAGHRRSVAAAAVIVLALWGIAVWVGSSVYYASVFAGGLLVGLLVLAGVGHGTIRLLHRLSNTAALRRRPLVRQGVANLTRPGAHATAVLTSLGIGVMFTLSIYFIQHSLLEEIRLTAPPDSPNVFLINITDREADGVRAIIDADPLVIASEPLSPSVSAQLLTVDGTPLESMELVEGARRFLRTQFVLTWAEDMPAATEILEGEWWNGRPAGALVSVQEFAAESLGLRIGSELEWSAPGGIIRARVANIRRTEAQRGFNNQFILSPGALDGFPVVYYGAFRMKPEGISAMQARIFDAYPTVTVVNAEDILAVIQEVVDRVSLAIRFVAAFAIFGGLIVLAASIAGTRYRRMREIAVLKTLGATRGKLVRMFSAEFAVIGALAGAAGAILGTALAAVMVGELLDTTYRFDWIPAVVATAVTTLLAVATGWLASFGIFRRKPLEILREIET